MSIKKPISCIAVFNGKIKGTVLFMEDVKEGGILIDINLTGLKKKRKTWISCS